MLISLIIPSFNQAEYLKETLHSILNQGIACEILVMDGGSTDGSVEIIQSYGKRVNHWLSEKDQGQTHAINKGLRLMSGDVWAYVNTDDPLLPGCLDEVRRAFSDPSVMWAGGVGEIFDETGVTGEIRAEPVKRKKDWLTPWNRPTPYVVPFSGCNFMRRNVLDTIGFFDESYHYSMDIEYGVRAVFSGGYTPVFIPRRMARWRWHGESKTMTRGVAYAFREDEIRIAKTYLPQLSPEEQSELHAELRREKLLLPPRKACAQLRENRRAEAFHTLLSALRTHPSSLVNRAWLGALRRALTP